MIVKTQELSGPALDWAVAKAEGSGAAEPSNNPFLFKWKIGRIAHYSTDWAKGGPIIERERISVMTAIRGWLGTLVNDTARLVSTEGPTALVAAMRTYVASKLGDEIEVPAELLQ
jgi:hypothetical protein